MHKSLRIKGWILNVEDGLEKSEDTSIKKAMEVCYKLAKEVANIKKIVSKNDDTYGNE